MTTVNTTKGRLKTFQTTYRFQVANSIQYDGFSKVKLWLNTEFAYQFSDGFIRIRCLYPQCLYPDK